MILMAIYFFKKIIYVGVQVKTRIDLNNIKILNILFLIFDISVNF
jgi:hypothetical protein